MLLRIDMERAPFRARKKLGGKKLLWSGQETPNLRIRFVPMGLDCSLCVFYMGNGKARYSYMDEEDAVYEFYSLRFNRSFVVSSLRERNNFHSSVGVPFVASTNTFALFTLTI